MIGAADVRYCASHRRGTPHTRRGDCKPCLSARRRATRQAKRSVVGSPLVRYGVLLRAADDLWSVWLRAFWPGCEMCRASLLPIELQCAHGFSREDRALRFDPDNTFALCAACHRRHTPPRADWWGWMRERLTQRLAAGIGRGGPDPFTRLELASKARGGKLRASDVQLVILDAQARIEALPPSERKEWAQGRVPQVLARIT